MLYNVNLCIGGRALALSSFTGGVHPLHGSKNRTSGLASVQFPPPAQAVIPMSQHIGAPCSPCVAVGERVLAGQVVGETKGFVSAPVHASVSGTVSAVAPRPHPGGSPVMSVVIDSDGTDEHVPALPRLSLASSREELVARIKECGVVGMGGATFPTHVKLSPPAGKTVDTLLLNAAECEPFLTADHRLMLEHPDDVAEGLRIAAAVLGVQRIFVGIEANKRDAAQRMEQALRGDASVRLLAVKYPQGSEKQLIQACTGRQVPSGCLPMDAGCVVINAGTAAAIARACLQGRPLISRLVSVTGPGVRTPMNLLCRLGTPFSQLLAHCGADLSGARLISGGPMMGWAQHDPAAPVIKSTSGLLVLPDETFKESTCIRCGRCAQSCPMRLAPLFIAEAVDAADMPAAEARHALDCMECGACTYICPARRELLARIRVGKRAIMKARTS